MTKHTTNGLGEALFKIRTTHEVEHNDNQWTTEFVYSLEEAKQAILEQALEIIGEDEETLDPVTPLKYARNQFRQSLREKFKQEWS